MANSIKKVPVIVNAPKAHKIFVEKEKKVLDNPKGSQIQNMKHLVREKFKNPETVKLFNKSAMAAAFYRAAYE